LSHARSLQSFFSVGSLLQERSYRLVNQRLQHSSSHGELPHVWMMAAELQSGVNSVSCLGHMNHQAANNEESASANSVENVGLPRRVRHVAVNLCSIPMRLDRPVSRQFRELVSRYLSFIGGRIGSPLLVGLSIPSVRRVYRPKSRRSRLGHIWWLWLNLSMTKLDWLYLALITVGLVANPIIFLPMFRRRSAADPRKAVRWLWFMGLYSAWIFTVVGIFLWAYEGRAWREVGLSVPEGWRLWGGLGVVLIVALVYARDVVGSVRARAKIREQLQDLGTLAAMTPRTRSEFQLWVVVSLTAGVWEEFLFRGYFIWVFHHWLGWSVAAAASLLVFALAHSYAGTKGVLKSAFGGVLFTAVVALCGSLLPAMVIHALFDVGTGYLAWLAFREMSPPEGASMPVRPT
jgi:membrane protease YdiL (CAAX protease family)